MNIVIPSYKRSYDLAGKDYFYTARYCVPESQKDDYANTVGSDRLVVIPDNRDGDIVKKRNWILENIERPLIMIDDDVKGIGYFESRNGTRNGDHLQKIMDPELFIEFCKQSFVVCEELGARMWGVNQNTDAMSYREYQPLSLSYTILGPFQGHLKHDLKFDERVGTKDDYDMSLQQLQKYHMIMRWNKYHYICAHGDNQGGIVSYRSKAREIEYCEAIMEKWGKKIIKYRIPPQKMTDLLNAKKVNIPIDGV